VGKRGGKAILNRLIHILGIHDWVPRFVVVDGMLVRRGSICTVCHVVRGHEHE